MNYIPQKFSLIIPALPAIFMLVQAGFVFAAVFNNDPQDRPTLRVQNFTVNGNNSTGWSTSTSGAPDDVISFAIYYHNTSNETAQDVRVSLSPQSTGTDNNHLFNATVRAMNALAVSGSASVGISSAQSMAYVPGSVVWRPNQTVWGSQALPFGQNGSEIFTSNGLRLGDIGHGWNTQGSVVLHFKISQTQVQSLTVSISANTTLITQGSAVTLSWNSSNADTCFASNGWSGTKSSSGSHVVTPSVTTTYTITCTNALGQQASDFVTVSVNQQQQNPTVSLNANPTNINFGNSATLSWNSTNANSCFATNGWSGSKSLSGSETVFPSYTTTYTMTCTGTQGQQVTQSATVYVNQVQQQLPTVTITASQSTISQGQPVVLNWNSQNATSCYVSMSWWGTKSLSGSETVYPVNVGGNANIYRITCSNSQGSQTATAYITVHQQQDMGVSIYANPTNINFGNSATLSWNSTNANSCFATNGWSGSKSLSGSETVFPSYTTTYTMTCTGTNGQQRTESVAVSVNQQQQNPTVSLNANPTQMYQGGSSVLVWNSNNTNSCYATGAWSGSKNTSGSQTVTPSVASTYTIVCAGNSGLQAQTSITVSVIPSVTPPPQTTSLIAACVPDSSVIRAGGQRVEFFAGVSGGRSPYYYNWSGAVSGNSDSASASYTTTGTKTAYLQVTDADGKSANAHCSVNVLPRLVTTTPPPSAPPVVVTQTSPSPQCVYCPVQPTKDVYYNPTMADQQMSAQPGAENPYNTVKKTERSIMASILLAEDGSPRSGVLFIFYLFLLTLIMLVLYFIYSLIETSRERKIPPPSFPPSLPRI